MLTTEEKRIKKHHYYLSHPGKVQNAGKNKRRCIDWSDPEQVRLYNNEYRETHREEAASAIRKWRRENPERDMEIFRKWFAKDPIHAKEVRRRAKKKWEAEHPIEAKESKRRSDKKRYDNRSQEAKARDNVNHRQWARNHPEAIKAKKAKRRVAGDIADVDLKLTKILNIQKHVQLKCEYCKRPIVGNNWHPDHIVAVTKNGKSELTNLCIACPRCNLSKGNRDVDLWLWNKQNEWGWLKAI